jgi:hypothetical protein
VAGYSATPLVTKLGIRAEHLVLLDHAPPGFTLDTTAHVVTRLPRRLDVALTFASSYAGLAARLPVLFERTTTAGIVWVCWPKKASGVATDLGDARVRALGLELGFVDVKVAAIDETWSGLKFVRRLRDRT